MNDLQERIAELEATIAQHTELFAMVIEQLEAERLRGDLLETHAKLPQRVRDAMAAHPGRARNECA